MVLRLRLKLENYIEGNEESENKFELARQVLKDNGKWNAKDKYWEIPDNKKENVIKTLQILGVTWHEVDPSFQRKVHIDTDELPNLPLSEQDFYTIIDKEDMILQKLEQLYEHEPEPKWMDTEQFTDEWQKQVRWHCNECGYSWVGGRTFECPRCHYRPPDDAPIIKGIIMDNYHDTKIKNIDAIVHDNRIKKKIKEEYGIDYDKKEW